MFLKSEISKRLWFLREKYKAEGLNEEEKIEYFVEIARFMVSEVFIKIFHFDQDTAKEFLDVFSPEGMKH